MVGSLGVWSPCRGLQQWVAVVAVGCQQLKVLVLVLGWGLVAAVTGVSELVFLRGQAVMGGGLGGGSC